MTVPGRLYTVSFFQVLAGAMLTMAGVSMQFHFGEYVVFVGHDVETLGLIAGIGALGSLFLRPYVGGWIDRFECRPCFLVSALGGAVANFSFQFTDTLWIICLARILMAASNATFLATVAVYAAHAAPPERRAESLGSVGIGGFLGMMIGPAVGDIVFANHEPTVETFRRFFTIVAAFSLAAGMIVANVRVRTPKRLPETERFTSLLKRYWPGRTLMVCVTFAACLTVHMTFLERFAQQRGFENIRMFFLVYGPTAILLRIVCRRVPQILGRGRVCAGGLCVMGAGMLLFIPVTSQWHLVFPAFFIGAGHAFVFPSMVDLVAAALPVRHRGVGTSIALGAMDIGFLLGGVAWGQLIDWRGFETTFVVTSVCTVTAAIIFALCGTTGNRSPSRDKPRNAHL